jgi:ABC-type microcin C transport system duplicated ATPase subunit YejF
LINHYVQSTAVDISLQGFLNILQFLKEMDRLLDIVPLFILHDAIILDVNENAFTLLNALCKIGSTDINGLSETKFYMSVDKEFALT